MKLAKAIDEARLSVPVLAISVDAVTDTLALERKLMAFAGNTDGFVFLRDEAHRVVDRYEILNSTFELPHPAVFVLDKQNVVRYRFVETNYRQRAPTHEVIQAVQALGTD